MYAKSETWAFLVAELLVSAVVFMIGLFDPSDRLSFHRKWVVSFELTIAVESYEFLAALKICWIWFSEVSPWIVRIFELGDLRCDCTHMRTCVCGDARGCDGAPSDETLKVRAVRSTHGFEGPVLIPTPPPFFLRFVRAKKGILRFSENWSVVSATITGKQFCECPPLKTKNRRFLHHDLSLRFF